MKRRAWHELSGAEQRADVAQGFVRLSCAGTLLSLCVAIVMTLTGHPTIWHDLAAHPLQTARGVLFLLLYISAAVLMGRRRPAGGLIAIGLFGYAIISLALRGRLVSLSTLWAMAGIVLVLRAADTLNLPFRNAPG